MACQGTGDHEFFKHALIYSNKLVYLQLTTVLVYGKSPLRSHTKGHLNQTFSKNLKKCV